MRVYIANPQVYTWQTTLYEALNKLPEPEGRRWAVPVALADTGLYLLRAPLALIENVAFAIINLVGAASSSSKFTLKDALHHTSFALSNIANIPVTLIMTPLHLFHQIVAGLSDPKHVESFDAPPAKWITTLNGFKTALREAPIQS